MSVHWLPPPAAAAAGGLQLLDALGGSSARLLTAGGRPRPLGLAGARRGDTIAACSHDPFSPKF